ncbi:MAG TPA: phosphate/phosphite/phosphonate ABC transporter substrate-binding protein [Puia sp.]
MKVSPLILIACTLLSCSHRRSYQPAYGVQDKAEKEILCGLPALSYNETVQPLLGYINSHLDSAKIRIVGCISVEDYEDKLRKGSFDITVINGPQLVLAEKYGYRVIGRIAGQYRSVIFVNKDSAIHKLSDLKGRTISFAGKNILAGAVMPCIYLYHHGLDVNRDIRRRYTPSFESALMDVCLGKSSAGAVWGVAFQNFSRLKPELASHLEVKWVTPSLPSSALMIRRDMDARLADRLRVLFFHLQDDSAGRHALATSGVTRFEFADSSSYAPMKQFIREFNSLVH